MSIPRDACATVRRNTSNRDCNCMVASTGTYVRIFATPERTVRVRTGKHSSRQRLPEKKQQQM
eukprot:scaffold574098_cov19-Prasinocladus_malaysianus.AAC.1